MDIFDPAFDATVNSSGNRMCDLYSRALAGKSQEQVFWRINRKNRGQLRVLKADSRTVRLPDDVQFAFGFIDGNHDPTWVESDFLLIRGRLHPGGVVGFHDYGGDLPLVTQKIDELVARNRAHIADISIFPEKWLLFATKAQHAKRA